MERFLRTFFLFLVSLLFIGALFFPFRKTYAAGEFITTWKTDNAGVSDSNQILIPTYSGLTYHYNVGWGDGTFDSELTGDASHTYAEPGTYTVSVSGTFPGILFALGGDRQKLLSIEQWGDIDWKAMAGAFFGCINMSINATDTPDLNDVADFGYTFRYTNFSHGLENWDVSHIVSMFGMFQDATFNGDISRWDVSHVTNFSAMFYGNNSFNQDIGNWNTSNATTFYGMFYGVGAFNQDIRRWDVSHVTAMNAMFYHATSFNQDLSNWNVGQVTNMHSMFDGATSFDQNLGKWDVTHVTDMTDLFAGVRLSSANYDGILSSWAGQTLQPHVSFSGGNSTYCDQQARQILTNSPNHWSVTDGGYVCLIPRQRIPAQVSAKDAAYYFTLTPLVQDAYQTGSGSFSATTPACASCQVNINPAGPVIAFEGLRVGEVIDIYVTFTNANRLHVGPFTVIAESSSGGMLPIIPTAFSSPNISSSTAHLFFQLNEGAARTTSPLIRLTLNGNPSTIRGYVASLDPTFKNDSIYPLPTDTSSPATYLLPNRPGIYHVYLKYYSHSGIYSDLFTQTIELVEPPTLPSSPSDKSTLVFCRQKTNLQIGDKGEYVRSLQAYLKKQGKTIYPEQRITGTFGPATKRAVIRFQEQHRQEILIPSGFKRGTGMVGTFTLQAMCR